MKRPKGPSSRKPHRIELRVAGEVWECWYSPYTGLSPFALRPPGRSSEYPEWYRQYLRRSRSMKRPEKVEPSLPSLAEREECVTLSRFPALEDLLCDHNWEDLSCKGRRCLMLFIDESAVRLLVKLDNDSLKASCVARGIDDVLMTMEQLLKSGTVVWEQDTPPPARGKKKGK